MVARIVAGLRNFSGFKRKKGIIAIFDKLARVSALGQAVYSLGDDAGIIRDGSEYLLLAAEEINRSLVEADPRWAGFCAVLTNVNDIYAMGGVPLALVNTVSFKDQDQVENVFLGVSQACEKYNVPMVGGHLTPESDVSTLSAAVVGKARRVLTSFDARVGDSLIIAAELTGKQYKSFMNWDCISDKTPKQVLEKLEVMPFIAEQSLAHAAKDISNAGIMGTVCMLLETSGKGAEIAVDAIPTPKGVDFLTWLKMYPSYGFILSVPPGTEHEVMRAFSERRYAVARIGVVNNSKKVILRYGGEEQELFNFNQESMYA